MIKAPYNFVPLNEHVFFPDWADKVSHDVPFEDGESGCITIKLTAKSPIYVRNGGAWPKDNEACNLLEAYQAFSNINGKPFIPATSIKGMIRNVLEIMSFGKMGGRINERHKFSYRDLGDSEYRKAMTYPETKSRFRPKVRSGWLNTSSEEWNITPCECARVDFSDLGAMYRGKTSKTIDLNAEQPASDKYENWKSVISLDLNFDFLCSKSGSIVERHQHSCVELVYRKADNLGSGTIDGTLVFTGQPERSRKHMEFIFHTPATCPIPVPKDVKEDFLSIHSDNNGKPNQELAYLLNSDNFTAGIPVFFLPEGTVATVSSMGLAMMYRLPFSERTGDLLCDEHKKGDQDLADLIFGSISKTALKGRVHFSHAFAEAGTAHHMEKKAVSRVLASPKASYEPIYLQKNGNENGTYKKSNSRLKGWKRYPVHSTCDRIAGGEGTATTTTKFLPLKAGAEFKCKIRFHNLCKAEIGALLSAITFHGNQDRLFHTLGMAKSLGCGKTKLEVLDINATSLTCDNFDEYFTCFTKSMEKFMGSGFNWRAQPQIDELLTMAHEQENQGNSVLQHMILDPLSKPLVNDFAAARTASEHLEYYSKLQNIQKITLKTVENFKDEIQGLLDKGEIKAIRSLADSPSSLRALTDVLADENRVYDGSYKRLYARVENDPAIILKIIHTLKTKEIETRIGQISNPDKNDEKIQELFDWLIDNNIIDDLENIPAWAESIKYGWEHKDFDDEELLDIISDIGKWGKWPSIKRLRPYLISNSKNYLLELLDEQLEGDKDA